MKTQWRFIFSLNANNHARIEYCIVCGRDEDTGGEDKAVVELKESYHQLNAKQETLETKVTEMQSSLSEILSLLKK